MLYLVTGVPGSGKTLFTIADVAKLARETGRPVYTNGVPLTEEGKTKLGWLDLVDAEKWYELGATSIVVIDEAQRHFRPRPRGAPVPQHFAEFETHRHGGIDVYILTQDPMLIDSHVRKLVGKHIHVKRLFGTENATVTEWLSRVATSPSKKSEYVDSRSVKRKYPREVYELYKSAEVHTHKTDLPWRQLVYITIGLLVLLFGIWEVRAHFRKQADQEKTSAPGRSSGDAVPQESIGPVSFGNKPRGNPWALEVQAPRVRGAPQTAAFYDHLQTPQSQPVVAGCMRLEVGAAVTCECHTSQGSLIDMSTEECVRLMHRGWFDPTRKAVDILAEERARLDAHDKGAGPALGQPPDTNASAASLVPAAPQSAPPSGTG